MGLEARPVITTKEFVGDPLKHGFCALTESADCTICGRPKSEHDRIVAKNRILGMGYGGDPDLDSVKVRGGLWEYAENICADPADDGREVTLIRRLTGRSDDWYRDAIEVARRNRGAEERHTWEVEIEFALKVGAM